MAAAGILELTDSNFEQSIQGATLPALVDFWAEWCGPCRRLAPIVDEIATEYSGKLLVGKVDIDANAEVATRFGIQSIPTLLLFKNGQVVDRIIGAQPKEALVDRLNRAL